MVTEASEPAMRHRSDMRDLTIRLPDRRDALADVGDALGRAGVSIEGGAAFTVAGEAIAHFLFEDGVTARTALEAAGFDVLADREVLVQHLDQQRPGELGRMTRRIAEAGLRIEVLYSDHQNQLILVVDDVSRGQEVSRAWSEELDP